MWNFFSHTIKKLIKNVANLWNINLQKWTLLFLNKVDIIINKIRHMGD